MRVLVTGGAGYIGSHAVKALIQAGHSPIIVDNLVYGHREIVQNVLRVPLVVAQIGDTDVMEMVLSGSHPELHGTVHENQSIEAIMHFAAYAYVGESVSNPSKYYRNNLGDTFCLLEHLVRTNRIIPFVFSSTCATYGLPQSIPINEEHPQQPINPYGKTKFMVEQILNDFAKAYRLPSVIFRYFNAAGADPGAEIGEDHDPETHLIPRIFDVIQGREPHLEIYGNDYPTPDGTCIRDYIHVSDLAQAHVLGLEKYLSASGIQDIGDCVPIVYNLGNGIGFSVKEVIETSERVTGRRVHSIYTQRREGDPPILVASSEKARTELEWKPQFPELAVIIEHAWRWYQRREHANRI